MYTNLLHADLSASMFVHIMVNVSNKPVQLVLIGSTNRQ